MEFRKKELALLANSVRSSGGGGHAVVGDAVAVGAALHMSAYGT
jgi:hypothetical protein